MTRIVHLALASLVLAVLAWARPVAAAPLIIDGTSPLTTQCPAPGVVLNGGRACRYGGTQTFDYVDIRNGGVLYVAPYDGANKATTGNLVVRATGRDPTNTFSIRVDRSSRIDGKGAGYQGKLCDNGPGPAGAPLAGGRGGCGVRDSGGGGGHFGRAGRGTKDNPNLTNDSGWEEDCLGQVNAGNSACVSTTNCRNNDALPTVAGLSWYHSIYDAEFGPAGGDKGCRDGDGFSAGNNGGDPNRSGDGGARIVLFAATGAQNGVLQIDGRILADGRRGCAQGNDSAGGGAGGVVFLVADQVQASEYARVSAHGGRGGDSQPKCLPCTVNSDCYSVDQYQSGGASLPTGQTCQTFVDPQSGNSYGLCSPCNCKPCSSNAQCDSALGQTCKALPGYAGGITVCADSSNRCTPFDRGDDERECAASQNLGLCDDCGGGGGGGLIRVESRSSSLHPHAIFDVRGAKGGICPVCEGEAGGGVGELQLDAAFTGEICDGYDNDFDGSVDEGLGTLSCPSGSIPACVGGVPQDCTYDSATCSVPAADARPRFALILDTSGSMLLDVEGDPTFGDGSVSFPGVDTNSDADALDGNNSRLYVAKRAVSQVLSAFPESDYALGRYYQDVGLARSCQTASNFECSKSCCSYDTPVDNVAPSYPTYYPDNLCIMNRLYPAAGYGFADPGRTTTMNLGWATPTANCVNYAGSCGPPRRGAQYLVGFGAPIQQYLTWLDGAESNFQATTVEGDHCAGGDCELRGTGPTPLAGSLQATQSYLAPIVTCDAARACRTYATILLTDGVESCQGNPAAAAASLRTAVPGKTIDTYVIGFSIAAADRPALNAIATAGGTNAAVFTGGSDAAFFVSDESSLANAIASIVASSQVFEQCNGLDDNCNQRVDEGLAVYQECTSAGTCASGACDLGRCTCTTDADCDVGYACQAGSGTRHCRPACAVGLGACQREGVTTCGGACCVNDGLPACTALTPGAPSAEICNGLDDDCDGVIDDVVGGCSSTCTPEICNGLDDDCDGTADDSPTDVGSVCGYAIGVCTTGLTVCVAGTLECSGAVPPGVESCNGRDDDCDGVVDGMTRACYSGPGGTQGVGACRGGTQACTAPAGSGTEAWGACVGQITPTAEVCNGIDDDCDGTVDDVPGAGATCCPTGDCCVDGTRQCSGGTLQCVGAVPTSTEVCNGIDDDCDGTVDDVAGVGGSCCPSGSCGTGVCVAGTLACQGTALVCQNSVGPGAEICDTLDNDCNGTADDLPGAGAACCPAGRPCGVGICTNGTRRCVTGQPTLQCGGGTGPGTEVCNGDDDDCNGLVDDVPGANTTCCTSGLCGTGVCASGTQKCVGTALTCTNEVLPGTETCNQLDDDCDGTVDDVTGLGDACCPFLNGAGQPLCGVGICQGGTLACVSGQSAPQCTNAIGPVLELCNGLDDDCDGTVDDLPGGTVGGTCCPSGKCGTGVCAAGTLGCGPSGIECLNAVNPSGEVCDTLDNDCNGTVDDVPGLGTTCCPGGNCGVGVCLSGQLVCGASGLECSGSVSPGTETCNGLDDDCNGVVDDVPTIGTSCCPDGSAAPEGCNKGVCRPGQVKCVFTGTPGTEVPLVCDGGQSAGDETCNGLDDDCDGTPDDETDVAAHDPLIGQVCDAPLPPNDQPPCQAGTTVCRAGNVACEGAVSGVGKQETCNGRDENCDGLVDNEAVCPDPSDVCVESVCASECDDGEFPCPGGFVEQLIGGSCYCVKPGTGTGGTGGTGSGGTAGTGATGSGGTAGTGATGSGGTAGTGSTAGTGATGSGGTAGTGATGSGGDAGTGSTAGTGATGSGGGAASGAGGTGPGNDSGVPTEPENWGLATGGGGCACRVSEPAPSPVRWGAALAGVGLAVARRRRGRRAAGGAL